MEWARSVRRDLLHRRAAVWSPVLDELEARREVLRQAAKDAIDTTELPWAVSGDTLVTHDRALWRARCLLWLDSDATDNGLACMDRVAPAYSLGLLEAARIDHPRVVWLSRLECRVSCQRREAGQQVTVCLLS